MKTEKTMQTKLLSTSVASVATHPCPASPPGAMVIGSRWRNSHFGSDAWGLVEQLIGLDWSPEQVSGWLRRHELLTISYKTIYLYVWREKRAGGELWTHMRQAAKRRRKR